MNLDFSKIDLIFENAQLKLELMKNDYQVKPEPVVIEKPCSQCRGLAALSREYERNALQGSYMGMLNNSQAFAALSGATILGAIGQR
jgi:hypothetical protein